MQKITIDDGTPEEVQVSLKDGKALLVQGKQEIVLRDRLQAHEILNAIYNLFTQAESLKQQAEFLRQQTSPKT